MNTRLFLVLGMLLGAATWAVLSEPERVVIVRKPRPRSFEPSLN